MSFPDKKKFQIEYSDEIVSFIKGLLKPERAYRLGNNRGAQEVLEHPFLKSISSSSQIQSPLEPLSSIGQRNEEIDGIENIDIT